MNNLQNLYTRLNKAGGSAQQERMIEDKRKTLQRAVKYSYQGAQIALVDSDVGDIVSALVNPNRVLADYDEKILSVEFGHGFSTGKVFRWINPSKENGDTYWLIYLQDLTELAYFKANVRKCNYSISWIDDQGKTIVSYAAMKGPKEEGIVSRTKSNFNMDVMNYTLSLLVPKNSDTLKFFQRYAKFYLQNLDEHDSPICWQVEAIDSLSTPGILEVYAKEHYINNDEDDVDNGLVGGLIVPKYSKEQLDKENEVIVGDNFIKPGFNYVYECIIDEQAEWQYDHTLPIDINIDHKKITLLWTASYSGSFILQYGAHKKTIVVESLF